ncbi:MAG TPA: hypothetical protein PLK80_08295, partial [bacterium]|nr:hypothetical protein [bacterium]
YLNRLDRALRRLQTLFTPEQYEVLFEKPLNETASRAARKIPVNAAVVVRKTTGGLDRHIELSAGYKKGKWIKRNVFVKADDAEAVREFRERYSDTDVYRSTYEYLCDRTPEKGVTRFCPKRGDFVIELESETGEHHENVACALKAARHCAKVIEGALVVPRDAISYLYNGGKSFYLIIPQRTLGLPDCVELNVIYERVARHIRDNMDEKYRGMVDMSLYNHDRPLRIPGTTHPKHGLYNTRLTTDEFFNLAAQDIIRLARLPRETANCELHFEDSAASASIVHELTKDIPRTESFDSTRKPLRINMAKKNWHVKTISYLRERGLPVRIPCAETLTALIHSGGHTGFEGRVKLVTELRDAGESEEDIIRIFTDSPHFHEKYFNDIVRADTRPHDERNGTGYMIRPDIWNDYSGISCARCQEWCSPGECYRNAKVSFFNEDDSPNPAEFRDTAREALRAALTEIMCGGNEDNPFGYPINLVEAPMASGKTYQAVAMALELAAKKRRSLILAPDHTVCAEAVGMAEGMEKPDGRALVHLVGKNENSCADIAAMVGPCSSCKFGVKATLKKAPEFVEELLSSLNGIYSLTRMKEMLAELDKEPGAPRMCLRTLSMLIAPRADIVAAPFVFLIDHNLSVILGELPDHIFIDEGDTFADQLADYYRRSITVALPRVTNSGCIHTCRKPRCNHCKLSYSSVYVGGDMEPRARASDSAAFGDPADFIDALEDALNAVRREIGRGVVRRDIFDLDAVERNIGNLRAVLKPKSHYLRSGETDITVAEHLARENAALVASPGATHEVVDTGPVFGAEGEITKFPFVKFEKVLKESGEIQRDEEPLDRDSLSAFRFAVSSIYTDRETYSYYKDGDPAYRNCVNIFLKFAEFCENAPGGALLRHAPRCAVTESACKIVLSYIDDFYFDLLMFRLMLCRTAFMSGTFMNLRMAAAALLLKESRIRYYTAPVKMHDKCALVLHNSALGAAYMAGDVRGNSVKPKVLNYDSFFNFFSYCIDLLGDGVHLYYFGKNKNTARALYHAYKQNGGRLPFKANLVNSNGDIVFSGSDEPLFQANAPPEVKKHLERESRMFIDNYRSSRSRGKNLPDFQLSIADGNGRANFDRFFDYVAAINRATGQKITMGELLDYNRARVVCQAMLRTPRDDRHKHLIVYNGDMSMFDAPEYLRNRVVLAEDIYRDYFEGTRKKRFEEL